MRRVWLFRWLWAAALPSALAMVLFVAGAFIVLIPTLEQAVLDQKRTMIRELTTSAWNILSKFEHDERAGRLPRVAAQRQAVEQIRNLHYGQKLKDYFWINDMHPRMIIHPYRADLNGQDLSGFRDPDGKYPFREFVAIVKRQGSGYVRYRWQWKDDATRVLPKLSYVKGFAPWGWVIGTGVYIDDVQQEVRAVTRKVQGASAAILLLVSLLLGLNLRSTLRSERQRRAALDALEASERRYRAVVESAGESIFVVLEDRRVFANESFLSLVGYSEEQLSGLTLDDLFHPPEDPEEPSTPELCAAFLQGASSTEKVEVVLKTRTGAAISTLLSLSRIEKELLRGFVGIIVDRSKERAEGRLALDLRLAVQAREVESDQTLALLMGLDELDNIETPEQLAAHRERLSAALAALVESGIHGHLVNALITRHSDAVMRRCVELARAELGPAPAPFVVLCMGSMARREQTLCTDQDNALLIADRVPAELAATKDYFLELGKRLCGGLEQAGYARCSGGLMADNPEWVCTLTEWRRRFDGWIDSPDAEALLNAKIFFDIRDAWGDAALYGQLLEHLDRRLEENHRFFTFLAHNVLLFEPPLSRFGSLVVEEGIDGRGKLDIKGVMTQVVDFARIYGLRHGLRESNTLRRIQVLAQRDALKGSTVRELSSCYRQMMRIRLEHQVQGYRAGQDVDNLIDPERLSLVDQRVLKEAFARIKDMQVALGYDFTGAA